MGRGKELLAAAQPLFEERFAQSLREIEAYGSVHGEQIARQTVAAFVDAATQASALQRSGQKAAVRFVVLSHLHSAVNTGGYAIKLDLFDHRFYADTAEVEAVLSLDWLYPFLEADMVYLRGELAKSYLRLYDYELEEIRYRYVWYYHALARQYVSENIAALLEIPQFAQLERASGFEVLFGEYMGPAEVIWRAEGEDDALLSAGGGQGEPAAAVSGLVQ